MSDLIENMLHFNPIHRCTAKECFEYPLFFNIRVAEATASKLIECPVDDCNIGNTPD